jgi:hypothetical protein
LASGEPFVDMGVYRSADFNFIGNGEPAQVSGVYVSASLFRVLEVTPLLGRNFLAAEDRAGAACSAILSYSFWKSQFGSDPHIISRILTLNVLNCTVVGVLRHDFRLDEDTQLFQSSNGTPLNCTIANRTPDSR